MASTPAESLAGILALGGGVLLAYGAYKNVPVFGPGGLLTGALEHGKLMAATGQSKAAPPTTPHIPAGPNPHGTVQ